jgi:adenylate cyclase
LNTTAPGSPASRVASSDGPGLLERLKRHKVIEWTLAYAAAAYTLLHGLEMLSEAQEWPHLIVRLASLALVLGTPVASLLAWYHGARGLKKISGPELAILTVLLFIAGSLLWYFNRERVAEGHKAAARPSAVTPTATASAAPAASIAVLPFADMSEKHDQEYFADGMAEEILNVLARVDGLKVASRSSSFQFRSQALGAPKMAAELGVRHLLEGSVRKSGDTVRITVQLIDTDKDQHLWSETYDRPLTTKNLFAIQDEVAKAVVTALRAKIGASVGEAAAAPNRTDNLDAYGLFLKARTLFQARRNLAEADRLLAQALSLDPKFADALAIRACIWQFGYQYNADFGDFRAAREQGRKFATEALALDSRNSLAVSALAFYEYFGHAFYDEGDKPFDNVFVDLDRAMALDPSNANAVNWQGLAYAFVGDLGKSIALYRRCIALDPLAVACHEGLAAQLLAAGQTKEATEVYDTAFATGVISPGFTTLNALAELNRRESFLVLANTIPGLKGWHKFDALYDAMRDPGRDHRALATELRTLLVRNTAAPTLMSILNTIGDYDQIGLNGYGMWAGILQPYRRSIEFKRHMRAAGVYDYWRAHGFPPQCHPVGSDDFECN